MRRPILVALSVVALVLGTTVGAAAVVHFAGTFGSATCKLTNASPTPSPVAGGVQLKDGWSCTIPTPPPSTVTATVTQTVTADPSSTPTSTPTTASPSPTQTTTSAAPSPSPTSTPTTSGTNVCQPGSEVVKFTGQGSAGMGQYGQGDYDASAEIWNPQPGLQQTMGVCSHSSWYVNTTVVNAQGAVQAYPSMRRFYSDPTVASFSQLKTSFAVTDPACSACIYDDAFDVWLNAYANELMIWTHNSNQYPAGYDFSKANGAPAATGILLDGHTWELYLDTADGIESFVPTDVSSIPSGTLDVKDFVTYLQASNRLAQTATIRQLSYGVETVSTAGSARHWDFTDFTINDGVNAP